METYVCRYEQVKETRDFIHSKVFNDASNYSQDNDLVIALGDFNMNGAELTRVHYEKLREAECDPIYDPVLPLLQNEYKSLIRALRSTASGPEYKVIDCARESVGGGKFSPITFADVTIDEDGNE